jgi:hypothetical protein
MLDFRRFGVKNDSGKTVQLFIRRRSQLVTTDVGSMASRSFCISTTLPSLSIR